MRLSKNVCLLVAITLLVSMAIFKTAAAQTQGVASPADQYLIAGQAFLKTNSYTQASQSFCDAIKVDPNSAVAYQGLGNCYFFSGRKAESLAFYQKSLTLQPDNPALTQFVQSLQAELNPSAGATISATGGNGSSSDSASKEALGIFIPQFSLNLSMADSDITISSVYLLNGSQPFGAGVGASLFVDYRPLQWISFGLGSSYANFFGPASFNPFTVDLGGRLFPLPMGRFGEFYLLGGVGLNLTGENPNYTPVGHYHAFAGPGYRFIMDASNALEMGIQYDFFSPIGNPLQEMSFKFGWTFLFNADK